MTQRKGQARDPCYVITWQGHVRFQHKKGGGGVPRQRHLHDSKAVLANSRARPKQNLISQIHSTKVPRLHHCLKLVMTFPPHPLQPSWFSSACWLAAGRERTASLSLSRNWLESQQNSYFQGGMEHVLDEAIQTQNGCWFNVHLLRIVFPLSWCSLCCLFFVILQQTKEPQL